MPHGNRAGQAKNLGAQGAAVIVANQRGVVPGQRRADRIDATRHVDRCGVAQRGSDGADHVGRSGIGILCPVIGIGVAQRNPAGQIADRGPGADIAIGIACRIDDRPHRRGLAAGPADKGRAGAEPRVVLHRAAPRHPDIGGGHRSVDRVRAEADRLVGQCLRGAVQHHRAAGIGRGDGACRAGRDPRQLEFGLLGRIAIVLQGERCIREGRSASARADQINAGAILTRAKLRGRAVIPHFAINRDRQIAGSRRQAQTFLYFRAPRCSIKGDGIVERRTVGTDLDRKIVAAGRAHFGPARKAGLKQQTGRIGGGGLVDLQLMACAGVGEQGRGRRYRQPVGRIRGGRNAKLGKDRRIFRGR